MSNFIRSKNNSPYFQAVITLKDQYGNNLFAKQSDSTKKVDQDRPFQNKCLYILDQNNFPNKLKSSSHLTFSFSVLPKSSYRRLLPKDR